MVKGENWLENHVNRMLSSIISFISHSFNRLLCAAQPNIVNACFATLNKALNAVFFLLRIKVAILVNVQVRVVFCFCVCVLFFKFKFLLSCSILFCVLHLYLTNSLNTKRKNVTTTEKGLRQTEKNIDYVKLLACYGLTVKWFK